MNSETSAPLTRKDLKEELHDFAQGWLSQALREALREALGEQQILTATPLGRTAARLDTNKSVKSSVKFDNSEALSLWSGASSALRSWKSPAIKRRTVVGPRLTIAGPSLTLANKSVSDGGLWQPSLKYEAIHAARTSIRTSPPSADLSDSNPRWSLASSVPSHRHSYVALSPAGRKSIYHFPAQAQNGVQATLRMIVESSLFEQASGLCVLLNAISLGYDTNNLATNPDALPNGFTTFTESFFCIIFLTEFLMRVAAFGCAIFTTENWRWNVLDMVLVSTQCFEQTLLFWSTFDGDTVSTRRPSVGIFRVLKLLRVIRIARLMRTFHLFDDLRVIVSSIMSSITSLGWSIFLLLILIYAFSLVFLQTIVSVGPTEHHDQIHYWFASLFRTYLTMFECVVGGVSWDEVVSPIVEDISPWLGVAFCAYISACLFAMMNLLTGIFVDKAMVSVREDKDVLLATRIRNLFLATAHWDEDSPLDDEITWDHFKQKLDTPAMKDYFFQINVDISEAQMLFDLMDADGSGSLSSEEIIRACLRLRGPARALDLSLLMKDVYDVSQQISRMEAGLRNLLVSIGAR